MGYAVVRHVAQLSWTMKIVLHLLKRAQFANIGYIVLDRLTHYIKILTQYYTLLVCDLRMNLISNLILDADKLFGILKLDEI